MNQQDLFQQIIVDAEQCIGIPYVRWGKDKNWFDCSGFILWLFSQLGIVFEVRFRTVEFFADAKLIPLEEVQRGDLMFWHEEPGKTEHNFVYHIEMIVDKPFFQNGKKMIKTIGASKNKDGFNLLGAPLESEGVDYRIREIDQRKSFGRVSYWDQILEYQKTWDSQHLNVKKPQNVKTRRDL